MIEAIYQNSQLVFHITFMSDFSLSEDEGIITKLLDDYMNFEFIFIATPLCNIALNFQNQEIEKLQQKYFCTISKSQTFKLPK